MNIIGWFAIVALALMLLYCSARWFYDLWRRK